MSDVNTSEPQQQEAPAYMSPGHDDRGVSTPDYMKPPGEMQAPDTMDLVNQFMGGGEEKPATLTGNEQGQQHKHPENALNPQNNPQNDATPSEPISSEGEPEQPQGLFDQLINKDAKPQEESVVDTIKQPEGMSDGSLEGWNALKTKAKDFERENAELKQQLQSYEGNPEQVSKYQEQIDALSKERDNLLNKIAESDLNSHPEFQEKYQKPLDNAMERLEAILEDSNSDLKAKDLLKMKKRDLADTVEEITDGMPKVFAREFVEDIARVKSLIDSRDDAMSNASQFMSKANEEMKTQAFNDFNQTAAQFKNEHGMLFNPLQATGNISEEQRHELETYNNALAEIDQKAQSFAFGQMSNAEMSQVAMQAAANDFMVKHAIPRLEKEYIALLDANKQMADQLKALKGAKPSVNNPQGGQAAKATSDMSRDELIKHFMGGGS